MNNYSPEAAVDEAARNYKKYTLNFQSHEGSAKALEEHYSGVKRLGHEAVSKLTSVEDSTKYGVHDTVSDGKDLMRYQGDSIHQGALNEAQAAGIQIEVLQPEQQPQIVEVTKS